MAKLILKRQIETRNKNNNNKNFRVASTGDFFFLSLFLGNQRYASFASFTSSSASASKAGSHIRVRVGGRDAVIMLVCEFSRCPSSATHLNKNVIAVSGTVKHPGITADVPLSLD